MTSPKSTPERTPRRWGRLARRIALGLVIAMAIGTTLAWVFAAPAYAEQLLKKKLADYWQGSATIGSTKITLGGKITFSDVTLFDDSGHQWACADALTTQLAHWPSPSPKLTELLAVGMHITAPADRLPPIQRPAPTGKPGSFMRFAVNGGSLTVAHETESLYAVDDLSATFSRRESGRWHIEVLGTGIGETLHLDGLTQKLTPDPDARIAYTTRFSGRLDVGDDVADFAISFRLRPEQADIVGNVDFDSQTFIGRTQLQSTLVKNSDGSRDIDSLLTTKGKNTTSFTYITGRLDREDDTRQLTLKLTTQLVALSGRGSVLTTASFRQNQLPDIHTRGLIRDMDFTDISTLLHYDKTYDGTLRALSWNMQATGFDLTDLTGEGAITLDDLSLLPGSHLQKLLAQLTDEAEREDDADLVANFRLADGIVTIEHGAVGGELFAIAAESGGTIDLQTTELGMTVVTLLMPKTNRVLRTLPGISLLTALGDDLTRTQVTGPWSAPEITPIPFLRGAENTVTWLQELLTKSDDLGSLILPTDADGAEAVPADSLQAD